MIRVDSRPEPSGLMSAGGQRGVVRPKRSARTRLALAADSPSTRRGLAADSPRTRRGLAADSPRTRRGLASHSP